jgi:hypothetical protein
VLKAEKSAQQAWSPDCALVAPPFHSVTVPAYAVELSLAFLIWNAAPFAGRVNVAVLLYPVIGLASTATLLTADARHPNWSTISCSDMVAENARFANKIRPVMK